MNENKENNNNIKIKNAENNANNNININNNNFGSNFVKKIKYIPYNKINMKKYNSESIIRIKKNEYKKLLSSESINEKNTNINTNNFINSGNKDIKFDNNNNNSSSKNIFFTKVKLSNINSRDNRDKKKFITDKFNSLSNRQSNSNDNIFNKKLYRSNLSLKEKITKEKNNKENGFLPELNGNNHKNRIINKNSVNEKYNSKKLSTFKSKTIFEDKMKYFKSKSISTDKISLNNNNEDKNINMNKNSNNVLINCSPSTSAYTNSTKKININKTNNLTDDLSKFRIGLLSAGTSSYSNVIIPMLSLRRPVSNFNLGGDKLRNNIGDVNINNMNILDKNNEIKEKNSKNENNLNEKEESVIFKNNNNNLNGIFNNNILYKNQKYNGKYDSENPNELMLKNMEKLIPKFHKIKIEKGMMNSKIAKNISKKLFINYYNQRNKVSRRFNSNKDRNSNNFIN